MASSWLEVCGPPLIIAHRGDSLLAPENTLPAFESAIHAGADLIELDYVHSADGVPFVFHDDVLDRTTDALARGLPEKTMPSALAWQELAELDAGGWFGAPFLGTNLPTLEEAIRAIAPRRRLMVERKAGDAQTLVDLLDRCQAVDRVCVCAFDWQFLTDCARLAPGLELGALGEGELTAARVDEARLSGASVIGWNNDCTTPGTTSICRAAGFYAWVWTVDDPQRAQQLASWGVTGLITNAPARIRVATRAES